MTVVQILAKLITILFWPFGAVIGSVARGIHSGFWYGYIRNGKVAEALLRSGLNDRLRENGLQLKEMEDV